MAKQDKAGKKKGKGKKAKRPEAMEKIALQPAPAPPSENGAGLPRVSPPALLLAAGALIAGGATALLRLRR